VKEKEERRRKEGRNKGRKESIIEKWRQIQISPFLSLCSCNLTSKKRREAASCFGVWVFIYFFIFFQYQSISTENKNPNSCGLVAVPYFFVLLLGLTWACPRNLNWGWGRRRQEMPEKTDKRTNMHKTGPRRLVWSDGDTSALPTSGAFIIYSSNMRQSSISWGRRSDTMILGNRRNLWQILSKWKH
jgi:hypothetical protein